MTLLTGPGEGAALQYAGQVMRVLAGWDGEPEGLAVIEMTVPARFAGPIPHAHDTFDEAIYVLDGALRVIGDHGVADTPAGSLFVAPRGHRHGFSNPNDMPARVLGLWSPAGLGLAFMRDVGKVLPASGPPNPDAVAETYRRHASRLLPE
jgi:mannose-6-phosphate isomerase-like protein (cupin superfamily)